ncbi:MAG: CBS domain-containing protein [Bacillota bacterium]
MPEKKVRDLMIPISQYSTVSTEDTVAEAIALLRKSVRRYETGECEGHRAVLVVDREGKPVGILTYRELIRAIEPWFLYPPKLEERISWPVDVPEIPWEGFFTERTRAEARRKVGEIMRPINLVTVEADAPLMKAVHLMVEHNVGTLPVMEDGRVVGVVRISELFAEVADTLHAQAVAAP